MQLTEKQQESIERFEKFIINGNSEPEYLVQIIELAGNYLNLQTISDYAKEFGISYNGVKKTRNIKELFNVKFVIDND